MPQNPGQDFEDFRQLFEKCSQEKQRAFVWLITNMTILDEIIAENIFSSDRLAALLKKALDQNDLLAQMLLLYQEFKQEYPANAESM